MQLIEYIISTIAPHICLGCDEEGSLLCSACARNLPPIPSRCYRCQRTTDDFRTCTRCRRQTKLHAVYAATPYEGVAKELLWKLKYERSQDVAKTVAEIVAVKIPEMGEVLLTYIPTAHTRVRMRGYDQARLIVRHLAARKGALCAPLLLRTGAQRQVGHKRIERKQQMANAFIVTRKKLIQGKHIVLIDDVITTGATLEVAAAALKAAGAQRVSAAVFAAA